MANFRAKLIQFMYGRYGIDQLYYGLIIFCFILMIINSFVQNGILNIIIWLILLLSIFRSFSKNINKRRRENYTFLKIWNPIKSKLVLTGRRIKEIKTNLYRTCPNCKVVLRLPRRKGRHTVECPHCHKDFKVKVRF